MELRDKKDPLLQLQKSKRAVKYLFNNLLVQTKGFKFVETLQVKFVKYSNYKKIQKNGYFNSTTDLIINEDRLAQLEEYRTTVREVVGSNPGRTTTQGL